MKEKKWLTSIIGLFTVAAWLLLLSPSVSAVYTPHSACSSQNFSFNYSFNGNVGYQCSGNIPYQNTVIYEEFYRYFDNQVIGWCQRGSYSGTSSNNICRQASRKCAQNVNTACSDSLNQYYPACEPGYIRNSSYQCVSEIPPCNADIEDGLSCNYQGETVVVGHQPGQFDKNYTQIVPSCPTGQRYILGSCSSLPLGLAAIAGTLQTQWEKLPNGVNQALGKDAQSSLSVFEELLQKERPAMSEFEKLLAKDGKIATSEFERLLGKEFVPLSERIAANAGILSKAVPILNAAAWAYTGWELYEYGKVLLDSRETREAFGGVCPQGFSGSDCDTPLAAETQWLPDDRPTYIWQPDNPAQPYVHHPRDPDRTVIDLTQTSTGRWEHVQYDNGSTGDIYYAPTVSAGPIIIERTELPNRGGRVVTVTTLTSGAIRGYLPDPETKPVDFTAPGPVSVVNPPIVDPQACTPSAGNPDLTPEEHIQCRRQIPKPISDPSYKPYPTNQPNPNQQTRPDKLPAPIAPPTTTPQPYSPPLPDPVTGETPSPFKIPDLEPAPDPNAQNDDDQTPFGTCGCSLQPPDLNAPTLAETTDILIEKMKAGVGADVQVPTMTGICPPLSVDLQMVGMGTPSTDAHCQLLEQNRAIIETYAVLFALISGVMIVLGP